MAYRQPTTSICLLKGSPCDSEYHNTVWYSSRQEQFNGTGANKGFITLCEHVWFNNQSFQRKGRNAFKIEVPVNSMYNYLEFNYVIFSNSPTELNDYSVISKSTRLYFAFIDTVEYINDNTILVTYILDYFQTYMFDYRLGACFVEREHSDSDNLYEHLEKEPFSPTEYTYSLAGGYNFSNLAIMLKYVPNNTVITKWHYPNDNPDLAIVFDTFALSPGYTRGVVRNKVYMGYQTVSFPLFGTMLDNTNIQNCLDALDIGAKTELLEICVIPVELCVHYHQYNGVDGYEEYYEAPPKSEPTIRYPDISSRSFEHLFNVTKITQFSDAKGNTYTPVNKKLYNYPYCSLYATTEQGEHQDLYWENFSSQLASFKIDGVLFGATEISLYPTGYNGKPFSYENRVSMINFPTCPWSVDTLNAYIQQNKGQITASVISSLLCWGLGTSIGRVPTGGMSLGKIGSGETALQPYGAYMGDPTIDALGRYGQLTSTTPTDLTVHQSLLGVHGQTSLLRQVGIIYDMYNRPDNLYGSQSYSQLPIIAGYFGFKVYNKTLKPYEAKLIDDYFSLFGYACNKLKVPNLYTSTGTKRPYWYYLKTSYSRIEPHVSSQTTQIDGYVNSEVDAILQSIYNKGITIWFNSSDVGDYSLNNSPITNP